MTAISDSVARNSILELNFESSANFDQIESREKLAFLLATSAKLTECNIENQTGTSKASVLVKYAKGIGKGMGQVIVTYQQPGVDDFGSIRSTTKTQKMQIIQ